MGGQSGRVAVGHPVDVASGALFNLWLDLHLPGSAALLIERYYSTALLGTPATPGVLGPGWRLGFEMSLRRNLEGFTYTNSHGNELVMEDVSGRFDTTGRLLVPASGLELRKQEDGSLLLIRYSNQPHPFQLVFAPVAKSVRYVLRSLQVHAANRVDLAYDNAGRVVRLHQTRTGRLLRLRHGHRGRLESISLDGEKGPPRVRYEYDPQGRLWRVSDPLGSLACFEYDAAGRMVAETKHTGAVFRFAFDAVGRCIHATGSDHYEERWLEFLPERRITHVRDSHGQVTTYEYNASGQVTSVRTPLGAATSYEFDDMGRLVAHTDANKVRVLREYDAQGRYCAVHFPGGRQVRLQHDDDHRQVALIDPLGEMWRYIYDSEGNQTEIIEPTGLTWRMVYDGHGDLVRVTNPLGHVFGIERDLLGRPARRIDWEGHHWTSEFDSDGRVLEEVDALGHRTSFQRDAAGRVIRMDLPDGRSWQFEHDAAGRVVLYRAPDGNVAKLKVSPCGHLLESTDACGAVTTYTWDSEPGRLLEIRNAKGEVYRREYDADGRPMSQTFFDGRMVRYEWDALGNCTAIHDSSGRRTDYVFDEWSQVLLRRASDGMETKYGYDANHLLTRVETAVTVEFERDVYGNVVAEVQDGLRIVSSYDGMSRRTEMRMPMGDVVRYSWSRNGDCVAIQRGEQTVEFVRDSLGREVRRLLPGGAVVQSRYDALSRLEEQIYDPPGWVERGLDQPPRDGESEALDPMWRRYGYDTFGRLSEMHDSLRGSSWFKHDKSGRLTHVLRPSGVSEAFEYDETGNRTAKALLKAGDTREGLERGVTRHGYEVGDRLVSTRRESASVAYVYDASGQVTQKQVLEDEGPVRTWLYSWSGNGELMKVRRPCGEEWTYRYDGLGRRIAKSGPQGERRFLWDGGVVLQEASADGVVTTWLFEPRSHRAVLQDDGRLHFILSDMVGSASEVVSPGGELEWASAQGAWAEPGAHADAFPLRFPGQWYDAETGWHYNRYRYYDPELGRYVSPDPIGLLGGFNLYSYVPSPVEWIDPLGLSATHPSGGPFTYEGGRNYSNTGRSGHATTGDKQIFTASLDKCLALVTYNGKTQAFVSGVPDGVTSYPAHPRTSESPRADKPFKGPDTVHQHVMDFTSGGINGNWNHAEMHAMNHVINNKDAYQGDVLLHIDRPPCREGVEGLGSCNCQLKTLMSKAKGVGVNVTVTYMDIDDLGNSVKKYYPSGKIVSEETGC